MKTKITFIPETKSDRDSIISFLKKQDNPNSTLHINTEPNTDPQDPPTKKQLYYLEKNDLPIFEGISFQQASDMIGKHKEKQSS